MASIGLGELLLIAVVCGVVLVPLFVVGALGVLTLRGPEKDKRD